MKNLLQRLLPPYCVVCSKRSDNSLDLCSYCENHLPNQNITCKQCGVNTLSHETLCGKCIASPPVFDQLFAIFQYSYPIDQLITAIKFQYNLVNARLFSELLIKKIKTSWYVENSLPQFIIPVPLHNKRLRQRGFNQALEIAKPIAKQMKIPLAYNLCKRNRATKPQSELPASKRQGNVKNAFSLNGQLTISHVAILDDVVTTGHTVNELSQLLKNNGVKRIDVWCCARTQVSGLRP